MVGRTETHPAAPDPSFDADAASSSIPVAEPSLSPDPDRHGDEETRGRAKLAIHPLSLPKNRSTGNLHVSADESNRSRYRMSFDATSASSSADHEALTRTTSLMADKEHGLGLSGLHRIRQQQPPSRNPASPSSSRSPSVVALSRTPSLGAMLSQSGTAPLSPGLDSRTFTEDLSRFPSESLHSFSFAHQSEDFLHNRQNVLKRSIEFMKDRMGWPMNSSQAGLASAQARANGDVDAQNVLELLARAQLIGAGNLPSAEFTVPPGPLTGPPAISADNVFDNHFTPRSSSPEPIDPISASPTASPGSATAPPLPNHAQLHPNDSQQQHRQPPTAKRTRTATTAKQYVRADTSQDSSRTPTDESTATAVTSPPASRPISLKRTMTDTIDMSIENKLVDTLSQPYYQELMASPLLGPQSASGVPPNLALGPSVHGHTNRWVPAAQAIFTTESKPPWTIIAANDLACLVFGVTKAEVRRMGILEVVQEERRGWLERKLLSEGDDDVEQGKQSSRPIPPASSAASALLGNRSGMTAQLIGKPSSRSPQPLKYTERRSQTVHSGDPSPPKTRGGARHRSSRSRGVLLCGDIVPIQKRNGSTGSASLWVKEKRIGLIWVLEEIHDDTACVELDEEGLVKKVSGATQAIWGVDSVKPGVDIKTLIPRIPRQGIDPNTGEIDFAQVRRRRYFTCPNARKINIPCTIEQQQGTLELRVSSYPHIAGMIVVDPKTLHIRSSNAVFCGALFGFDRPDGMAIDALIPEFDKILEMLTEVEGLELLDGMVVPEDRFRRASGLLAIREQRPDASEAFLKPEGLPAKHRDGSELKIDVQMRVVKSEKQSNIVEETVIEGSDEEDESKNDDHFVISQPEMVYALWITYSRHLHAEQPQINVSAACQPAGTLSSHHLHQPSPGQTPLTHTPDKPPSTPSEVEDAKKDSESRTSALSRQLKDAAMNAAAKITGQKGSQSPEAAAAAVRSEKRQSSDLKTMEHQPGKRNINDYTILEEMGQGAYGQVKLARNKHTGNKMVLKYVTKKRILVDTWTRDRKLGTVPLEIHVLDYLSRPEFKHPNIVEMEGFFEDDVNYYIEMKPHGLPGMDLFDYIELRSNMDESECRSIFHQVAQAIQFLHVKARVVHRDIKDENVILDGDGNIKLIDFGSAAYIKSGPFDVFVGTIDYAAPEVLAGRPYGGKEQDVWALGILLYTIIYKENPFYSIDEIMDRDLRIPFVMSEDSIDLIRGMLDRDVEHRYDIEQVLAHPWLQA
ncbi:protein-serine/threonine kinase [Geosmithia morbida]|uniref:non-specific serine/threonine protein kinase n=1 Tax=Geosmithia morbida TaxID=1094350 RepID=A0A9P4YYP1_9HYPO|nr:protein-serine/threonine kinase [Geosmithia morbida]KAF4124209.1 protein-serine/threonine kinase [Geosmithia morbida]